MWNWTRLIDSSPPATATGAPSLTMRPAASAIACRPEEQNRFTVIAEAVGGMPARKRRLPGDVAAGGALRVGATHHHVLHAGRVDAGALHRGADGVAAQVGAVGDVEGAPLRLADRGAGGGDDHGVGHAWALTV